MNILYKTVLVFIVCLNSSVTYAAKPVPPMAQFDVSQTVSKIQLAEGVSADDAIVAIKSKAIELNMKFVAHQPLSKELKSRGIDSGRLEIFQFCNPTDAHKMVKFNPIFAAYMPCRIALVEDDSGKTWLMMINLNMLINNTSLPPELKKIATRINTTLTAIMEAGASGDF
ncbi:MAG: DUF302 domain-containing protein [Gammaproteobacteria bacterium]|nr:DUF302 domain-containing protein [Gammaproteobacteria bacterium]